LVDKKTLNEMKNLRMPRVLLIFKKTFVYNRDVKNIEFPLR